nr:UDP-glycosyltransferase 90A1-like [Tanacetum cinerariifolium]
MEGRQNRRSKDKKIRGEKQGHWIGLLLPLHSILKESICSEVLILAWPMMVKQPLNAKMVVEEIKIKLRVETCDGSVKGFVKSEGLKKTIKELMEGEKEEKVRKWVKEVGAAAKRVMAEDGLSWWTLNELIDELQKVRSHNTYGLSYE